jgi:hypothetical protein
LVSRKSFGDRDLTQSDPTDDALATIASLFEPPEARREAEKPATTQKRATPEKHATAERLAIPNPMDVDGYSKTGPGPIAAIRFKWTVRSTENGDYYVEETIGANSAPLVNGPMEREAAIKLVDEREREAKLRFDQLRSEMTGRAAAAGMARKGAGEV